MLRTKLILAAMKTRDAQGSLGPEAVADLNKIANSGSKEEWALVRREFAKYRESPNLEGFGLLRFCRQKISGTAINRKAENAM